MKRLLIWGLVFLFGAALTTLALLDLGDVTIRWDVWEIDTSVSFVVAVMLVAMLVFYLLIRFWLWLSSIPARLAKRREIKRYQKAQQSLSLGLMAQEQADWAQAEKQLIKTAQLSENGVMHYLAAARMAHLQQASARCQQYLQQARQTYPDQSLMIGLVEAKLQEEQDPQTAKIILQELHQLNPNHKAVLSEYVKVLRQQKDAQTLAELRPQIKKHGGLSREDWQALEAEILSLRLAQAKDFADLEHLWQSLSSKEKLTPLVMNEYVQAAMRFNQVNGLAEWIEKALKSQWDESLVYLYGKIQFGPAYDRLKKAQAWLESHKHSAVLLLTLGRLACQSQLWGQAHGYLRESLRLQPELETFHALAQCYEAEGQDTQAALVYKQAMIQLDKPK
jgi:HemY protein